MFHGPRALVNVNDGYAPASCPFAVTTFQSVHLRDRLSVFRFGGATLIRQNLFFASVLETGDHGKYNRMPLQLKYVLQIDSAGDRSASLSAHAVNGLCRQGPSTVGTGCHSSLTWPQALQV
jgi:hypothetical protein